MAILTLPKDISEMSDEFTPLSSGTHICTVERVRVGKTQKGDTKFDVMWKDKEEGGVVWDTVSVNADFKIKQYAKLIGLETGNVLDTDQLVGVEAVVEVISDTYTDPETGETTVRSRVRRVSPA